MTATRKTLALSHVTWELARTIRDWSSVRVTLWPSEGPQRVNGFVVTRRGVRYRVTVEREP